MKRALLLKKNDKIYILVVTLCLLLLLMTVEVSAAPVRPVEVILTQPDGTQFSAMPWGDERLNGMETTNGYTILLSPETGFWVYARLTKENSLAPRLAAEDELVVGRDDPSDLPKHIRPEQITDNNRSNIGLEGFTSSVGTRKVLVLLVEFSDTEAQTTPEHWHQKVFGETNSLRHYYSEASFGQLTLIPAEESYDNNADGVVGWLSLGDTHPNPIQSNQTIIHFSREIARLAIEEAQAYVNFAAFDQNNNGTISYDELHIMIIVAGYERAYSPSPCGNSVWAHANSFTSNPPLVDGVTVGFARDGGGYTQVGEWHCETTDWPGHPATVGVLAHEFGHELGWPDLYDISFRSAGLGYWDVMAYGLWNNSGPGTPDGSSPALPNSWSRWHQGWLEPEQLIRSRLNVEIPALHESRTVYQLLDNPNGVDWVFNWRSGQGEYFLIENRQPIGFDVGLPGFGLLIWQIDESRPFTNIANADPNHRLVDLIQADGFRHLNLSAAGNRGDSGDPFPGTSDNRTFNAASNPSSQLYDGSLSGVSVTAISDHGPMMSANIFVDTFKDVDLTYWAWAEIESLVASGITKGCQVQPPLFCPRKTTTRAEMAVLMIRAIYGPDFEPPEVEEPLFADVDAGYWAAPWIEQLYRDGLTKGCAKEPLRYCPTDEIRRDEMAVFLVRMIYGPDYVPPEPTGLFEDVDITHWATRSIEQLYRDEITTGCSTGPLRFCPKDSTSRAQIAVFLGRSFGLSE